MRADGECDVSGGQGGMKGAVAEEWRSVPGDPVLEVSNLGRIRNVSRAVRTCFGAMRVIRQRLIATRAGKSGYVRIYARGSRTQFVHRLVAAAFVPNPLNLPVINHIDGNKSNNIPANLEWCTQADNMRHAHRIGLSKGRPLEKGERSIAAKLTDAQALEIKYRLKNGERICDMVKDYPIKKSAFAEIKAGRSWGHILCS